jgi:hypothetical protein
VRGTTTITHLVEYIESKNNKPFLPFLRDNIISQVSPEPRRQAGDATGGSSQKDSPDPHGVPAQGVVQKTLRLYAETLGSQLSQELVLVGNP